MNTKFRFFRSTTAFFSVLAMLSVQVFLCKDIVLAADSTVTGTTCITPKNPVQGDIKGLTLLIDFNDVERSEEITREKIYDMFNKPGYNEYENNGSIRDYFQYYSGGKLNYTNYVVDFYTPKKGKSYYDDNVDYTDDDFEAKLYGLIKEALLKQKENGFDFSALTKDSDNKVLALNVLYEGYPSWGFKKGLWPHQGILPDTGELSTKIDGIKFSRYQLSSINANKDDNTLSIGTIVHENGHLLCDWPDTYDSNGDGKFVRTPGDFDLMSGGSSFPKDPLPPNPYARNMISGWGNVISLNDYPDGARIKLTQNSLDTYIYRKSPDSTEYYLIESIDNTKGRQKVMPGSGLLIWKITERPCLPVIVIEADGQDDLMWGRNRGEADDFFFEGNNNSFAGYTNPSTLDSNYFGIPLSITNINSSGTEFTYHGKDLDIPTNLKLSSEGNYAKLDWNQVIDAVSYKISVDGSDYTEVFENKYTFGDLKKHYINIKAKDSYGRYSQAVQGVGIQIGDVNEDGVVSNEDKDLVMKYLMGEASLTVDQKVAADVDKNNKISTSDCLNILNYINKSILEFPAGKMKLIIYRDVDGDGLVKIEDINLGNQFLAEEIIFNFVQNVAFDIKRNDKLTEYKEISLIYQYISGAHVMFH